MSSYGFDSTFALKKVKGEFPDALEWEVKVTDANDGSRIFLIGIIDKNQLSHHHQWGYASTHQSWIEMNEQFRNEVEKFKRYLEGRGRPE